MVVAHREYYAAIGGAIENGVDRPLNWAVYYSDFGRYQNPFQSGESRCLRCKRDLQTIGAGCDSGELGG